MTLKRAHRKTGKKRGRRRASPRPTDRSERFLVREVHSRDFESVHRLASFLNSVNIPHDADVLKRMIGAARDSFLGRIEDPSRALYMFVMEGTESKAVVGTSLVYAQHGHLDEPHVFFDVITDERYSSTLDRHFQHPTLKLGFNYRGPTEIGALVLHPEYRSLGLGRPLSFVRFLFIAMFRERFRSHVIAELMPPLDDEGRSLLWEHLGRKFTGLGYQEADKLSHGNKEFIYALFPQVQLYASLLPPEIAGLIGQVGLETEPVRRMLESVGFEYSERIDPFDGGPHFEAKVEDIITVREARRLRVSSRALTAEQEEDVLARKPVSGVERRLVAVGQPDGSTKFRALVAAVALEGGYAALSEAARKILKVKEGDDVWATVL